MSRSSANRLLDDFIYENSRDDKEVGGIESKATYDAVETITGASKGWGPIKNAAVGEAVELAFKFSPEEKGKKIALDLGSRAAFKARLDRVSDVANIKFEEYISPDRANLNAVIISDLWKTQEGGNSGCPSANGVNMNYIYSAKLLAETPAIILPE